MEFKKNIVYVSTLRVDLDQFVSCVNLVEIDKKKNKKNLFFLKMYGTVQYYYGLMTSFTF